MIVCIKLEPMSPMRFIWSLQKALQTDHICLIKAKIFNAVFVGIQTSAGQFEENLRIWNILYYAKITMKLSDRLALDPEFQQAIGSI